MKLSVIFKIAAECNLRCKYCYWFADPAVLEGRPIASEIVIFEFVNRIKEFLVANPDDTVSVSLHGGEPLMLGKRRFAKLCSDLVSISDNRLTIVCQTNATLVDDEWISIFRHFCVRVGVSIDGPQRMHDERRVGKRGESSHQQVIDGYHKLKQGGIDPGILAVWSPSITAREIADYFTQELDARWFDVLMLDATRDTAVDDCSAFYCELFDLWLDELSGNGITVRICDSIARNLIGLPSKMESIGLGEVTSFSVNSDGGYELLDVLNIAGAGLACTENTIFDTSLMSFLQSRPFAQQKKASSTLCNQCSECKFRVECGGGYLPSRWSSSNGFDNPSAHCDSLYQIFEHCDKRLRFKLKHVAEFIRE